MTNITKQQAQRAISLIRAAQNTDYIEAMLDTLSRFIEQSTEPGEPSRAQLDAAWEAFQAHPVDHAEDSDDQQRLCVESAVRAAFRSIESSVLARQGVVREHLKARPGSLMKAPTPTTDGETR